MNLPIAFSLILVIAITIFYSIYYQNAVGRHYFINIENTGFICNKKIKNICDSLIENTNLHVLNKAEHRFEPHGYTCIYLLSESHLSAHTWPESNKICMDFFSCSSNKLNETDTRTLILSHFPQSSVKISSIVR